MGIERALRICRPLLRAGGRVAFTDAVWRKENAPLEVKQSFEADYPAMGFAADVLAAVERSGFEPLGHFTLPDEAWWDDFYTPMRERVRVLRESYAADGEALAALAQIERESDLHRAYAEYYSYEFFVARPGTRSSRTAIPTNQPLR